MADSRHYSREFLIEFIELYKSFPCLWKTKSKNYMNRNKKNDAYKILVEKWKEVEHAATKEVVKTKINSLRAGFRRETKKIQESKRTGTGADDIYVPHLWYYDLLLFLKDQDIPRSSVSNIQNDAERENSDHQNCDKEGEEFEDEIDDTLGRETEQHSSSLQSPLDSRPGSSHEINRDKSIAPNNSNFKKKRRNKNDEQTDEILALVGERLRASNDDRFTIFGNNVAAKLRTLPRETRLYTEKLINDLLFEAEMGHVTKTTKIVSLSDDLEENNPRVNSNRDLSIGVYHPHRHISYPLQYAYPHPDIPRYSLGTYPSQTHDMPPPQTQLPYTQSFNQPYSQEYNSTLNESTNESNIRETNIATFLPNFQSSEH